MPPRRGAAPRAAAGIVYDAGVGPRVLYLHGFASGPGSKKGGAFEEHFARRGGAGALVAIERLDLRVPSLAHLRLSAMIDRTIAAIGGARDRAVVIGSSLGGLTAARAAERDPRIGALVLLAPAFRFAERWRERLGADGFAAWRDTGWLRVHDHATGGDADVDFGFYEDAAAVDADGGGWPDVRVPTWIFHGVHDDVVDIARSRDFARARPHVRLVELDDGHDRLPSPPALLDGAERALAPWLPFASGPPGPRSG